MAKTAANLATETRIYLDEATQTDFLDTEVLLADNRAYQDVAGAVMEVYEDFYETTTPFAYSIVANQQEYTVDSSLIKTTRVEINYQPTTTGSTAVRALPIKEDEVRRSLGNTNNGSNDMPGYYLHGDIGAQKIGFVPVPTVSDTTGHSISVWGIAMPADLVNPTDNVNIPYADRFAYLISLRAAAQLLRKGQQEENAAQNYINEYQKGLIEMKTFLKERQSDDGMYITDSALEDIDFNPMTI